MSNDLVKFKKINRDDDIKAVQKTVSDHIPHLTAAALAAALGGTVVLKLQMSETGRMKYIPINDAEEITQALEWIAAYGNNINGDDGGFFILQQRPPDAKFWDALTNRHLGRIPEEAKIDLTHKLDLAEVGRKAIAAPKQNEEKFKDPIPSSWLTT